MKTNKHQTLSLIKNNAPVRARDIVNQFGYSSGTARSYLSYLRRHGLLERTGTGYVLTDKGKERLEHFEVMGCSAFDCALCHWKKTGYLTCPRCGYKVSKEKAGILPEADFLLAAGMQGSTALFVKN
jgi:predicted transcriptional regulator